MTDRTTRDLGLEDEEHPFEALEKLMLEVLLLCQEIRKHDSRLVRLEAYVRARTEPGFIPIQGRMWIPNPGKEDNTDD